jgi:SOS response regulatory protein OraA/RecX
MNAKDADDRDAPTVKSACILALRWLAGRDLTSAELTVRLRRRGCPGPVVAEALAHLRGTGAVNDERVAISRARIEAASRGRGRERVLLRLRSIGVDTETARRAIDAVFGELDETTLLERAVARRLKGPGMVLRTPSEYRRVYAALIRQGFPPADIRKVLDARRAAAADFDVDE